MPVPKTATVLTASANLGRPIVALLDPDCPVQGVTASPIRSQLRTIAVIASESGSLDPDAGHLDVTAGWGHAGKGGATMPALCPPLTSAKVISALARKWILCADFHGATWSRWVEPDDISALTKFIRTDDVLGATFCPKDGVAEVEIGDATVSSADGQASTSAVSTEELRDYWTGFGLPAKQNAAIRDLLDRKGLPGKILVGRSLGKTYPIVFIGYERFLPTDKVSATFFVDGVPKIFEFEVGAFAPKKRK